MKHSSKVKNSIRTEPWIKVALAQEDTEPRHKLWNNEPTAAYFSTERKRRVRFLRSLKAHVSAKAIAKQLDRCVKNDRCCSGACPECAHLLQRWTIRNLRSNISAIMDGFAHEVVSCTILSESLALIDPNNFV